MPDPVSPTVAGTATMVATAASLPVLQAMPGVAPEIMIYGVAIGLRADVLLAGFLGAVAAMGFFNTVPSSGDTWRELVRTTSRRMWHALASAVSAGYLAPLMLLLEGERLQIPQGLLVSVAFVAGAGAQKILARFIKRTEARAVAIAGGDDAAAS